VRRSTAWGMGAVSLLIGGAGALIGTVLSFYTDAPRSVAVLLAGLPLGAVLFVAGAIFLIRAQRIFESEVKNPQTSTASTRAPP
jgi:ABC-type Mn2+/Zn2+ transport system permease subunit